MRQQAPLLVPVAEVLGAVHAQAVGTEAHLAGRHLQQDGAHHRMAVVQVLPVHVRTGDEVPIQQRQRLVVGVAIDQVEHHLDRAVREGVQGGDEIHQLVRPAALEQARIDRRHGRDDHVVTPVDGHGPAQRHLRGVAAGLVVVDLEERRPVLEGNGRLDGHQLHAVVAGIALFERRQRLAFVQLAGDAGEDARQARQRGLGTGGRRVDLQQVHRRLDPRHAVGVAGQAAEVVQVRPLAVQPHAVIQLGWRKGAERRRPRQVIRPRPPVALVVLAAHPVQGPHLLAGTGRQTGHGNPVIILVVGQWQQVTSK